MSILYCLLIIGTSMTTALFCAYAFPFLIENARRLRLLDKPEARKLHQFPMPRLGGVAIIPAFWLGAAFCLLMAQAQDMSLSAFRAGEFGGIIVGLLLGGSGGFILGLYDDLKPIKATAKLAAQILIAALTVSFLPIPESVMGWLIPAWAWTVFAFCWLVIIPNSVNLLDGVDGLTGALINGFLLALSLLAIFSGQVEWLGVFLPLMAAICIFLKYNWNPASIFLGDSGSLSLGFLVAYLSLCFSFWPNFSGEFNPILMIALTSIWLFDTAAAILRRYFGFLGLSNPLNSSASLISRQFFAIRSVVRPDKRHIHHFLLNRGYGPKGVVFIVLGFWFSFMATALPLVGFGLPATLSIVVGILGVGSLLALSLAVLAKRDVKLMPKKSQRVDATERVA